MNNQAAYHRLNLKEREEISRGLARGDSIRSIARQLVRNPGNLSREINQPSFGRTGYRALLAEKRSRRRRRQQGRKRLFDQNPTLRRVVFKKLSKAWSPEQIVNFLKKRYPLNTAMRTTPETIYASIYVLPKGELRKQLVKALRQQRRYRRRKAFKTHKKVQNLPNFLSIEQRPKGVENRRMAGHWEGDLILGRWKRSALGTVVERKTRFLKLIPLVNKDHESVRKGIQAKLNRLPPKLKRSLTWDQGGEMSSHEQLTKKTRIVVYFAHPASPWERGTNENTNMLIRQFFPKGTDFSKVSRKEIGWVEKLINERPRKGLRWRTPKEAFHTELLR